MIFDKEKYSRPHAIALLVIMVLGAVLRLVGFFDCPFTHDELSAIGRLRFDGFLDMIHGGVMIDGHPAGVQSFLWIWTKMFGFSEVAIRLPFVLMGIACIPLMYLVTKIWFNRTAGIFAASIIAVSQYTIYYSIIARPYIFGLFFVLLALVYWSRMIYEKDYSWKNVIMFGIFASCCAYTHQFSMMVAFLIGIAGLLFQSRKSIMRYLLATLVAVVLYVPHIPITIYQLTELKGIGGWLGAPTFEFVTQYFRYLTHFSYIVLIIVVLCILVSGEYTREHFSAVIKKIITAVLLFVIPFATGYWYSVLVEPVLQQSCLIFSFPFLVLAVCSLVGENFNPLRMISVAVYCVTMVLSLIFVREHYAMIGKSIYGPAVKKVIDCNEKYGEKNVCGLLNISDKYIEYYENKYDRKINNRYVGYDPMALCKLLENEQTDYLVAACLDDFDMYAVKRYYPYMIDYSEYIGTELYVMSKTEHPKCQMPEPMFDRTYDLTSYNIDDEWYTLLDTPFVALSDSRYVRLDVEMFYTQKDTSDDFLIALQTFDSNGDSFDWREARVKNFSIPIDDSIRCVVIPLRCELIFKDSRRLSNYSVKSFLWNIDHVKSVRPISARIRVTPDNRYIYSYTEELE